MRRRAAKVWRYSSRPGERDARLDFIRGFAAVGFVTAHFEAFNWLDFVYWERLGIFSGAELFVLISGLLVGLVHREEINRQGGLQPSMRRLWRRAFELYRAYVVVIALVALVAALQLLDSTAVTTFTDRSTGMTYPLYSPQGAHWGRQALDVLLLRSSPHQVQILGLYTVLLLATPLVLWMLHRGWGRGVMLLSLALWALSHRIPAPLTGAKFEQAFPPLAWQLYFFCAMTVGYHARYEISAWMARHRVSAPVLFSPFYVVALGAFVFAQTTDNPAWPAGLRLDLIAPETFRAIYDGYFLKNTLGPGRVLSTIAFLATFHSLLTAFWRPLNAALGPALRPLGEASLYVFLAHVLFLLLADQIPGYFETPLEFDARTVWFNTAVLLAILGSLWLLVRYRVLFRFIPR